MLGSLDTIIGWVVVVLVTGAALFLLVQIQRDQRRTWRSAPDEDEAGDPLDFLRRIPSGVRLGILAATMLTAAALQLATLEPPSPAPEVETAEVVLISASAPVEPAASPQGLSTATVVGLALLVIVVGLGAPFWFDSLARLLRGRPRPGPPSPDAPASREPASDLDKAA